MIYFTTLFFTLLLSHIVRTAPACDDANPQYPYDPMNEDVQDDYYSVRWNANYDQKFGDTSLTTCAPDLQKSYPHFKDFPHFSRIGASFDAVPGTSTCGQCWELYNPWTKITVYFITIDHDADGFTLSQSTFKELNGNVSGTWLQARAKQVPSGFCFNS